MRILATIFSGILIPISCLGQTSSGRIAGSVTDQTGAGINGAVVTVVDERTNRERKTNSGEDGNYAFTGLDPSNYTLRASQSGFSTAEIRDLPLQVGQEVRRNLELSVSNTSSVIEVSRRRN